MSFINSGLLATRFLLRFCFYSIPSFFPSVTPVKYVSLPTESLMSLTLSLFCIIILLSHYASFYVISLDCQSFNLLLFSSAVSKVLLNLSIELLILVIVNSFVLFSSFRIFSVCLFFPNLYY